MTVLPPRAGRSRHRGGLLSECSIVEDAKGQPMAHVHFEDEPLLTSDEAWRVASNIATLPGHP